MINFAELKALKFSKNFPTFHFILNYKLSIYVFS